jgi:hypothetical protein
MKSKKLYYEVPNGTATISGEWISGEGIPFIMRLTNQNGNSLISFECIAPHGLSVGEYVKLPFSYNTNNLFQVYSLGNGLVESSEFIFNIYFRF